MSRSQRHTPIFGITTARSEREDKRIWHKRLRAHERTALSQLHCLNWDNHIPVHHRAVSDIWSMAKDGRRFWPLAHQADMAAWRSRVKACTPEEQKALEQRLMRRWMAK